MSKKKEKIMQVSYYIMLIAGYSSTANYINHHLFLYYLEANFNGFELTFMLLRYFRYQRDIHIY